MSACWSRRCALLRDVESGKPTDPEDAELAATLAARLAIATHDPAWIDYPFRLYCVLRQLIPSAAIDQIQAALHLVRGANRTALDFHLSARVQ